MKKIIATILCLCMLAGSFSIHAFSEVNALCYVYNGNNHSAHNYYNYAYVINSYLVDCADNKIMRFQYDSYNDIMLAEYYAYDYEFISGTIIPEELPIFGGFYATDDYYFILTGMSNSEESELVECFRITKYDKDWNRITSVGLYDCNTTIPFRAGTARFAQCGKYLLIRTSHQMYKTSDGLNHQANVTIEVDTDSMEITDSYTIVMNSSVGYVSHSFNQFIEIEDNKIVAVDHGDAYPRCVVLMKYNSDASDGTFQGRTSTFNMLPIYGETGDNYTGCKVGDFVISDTAYVVAGTSVEQNEEHFYDDVQNIFISSLSKETGEISRTFITDYQDESPSVPYLVSLESGILLLWEKGGIIYFTELDSDGNMNGDICEFSENDSYFSDCQPIICNEKLIWTTYSGDTVDFYEMDLSDLSKNRKIAVYRGHEMQITSSQEDVVYMECAKCAMQETGRVPTQLYLGEYDEATYYLHELKSSYNAKTTITVFPVLEFNSSSDDNEAYSELSDVTVSVSDEAVATVQQKTIYGRPGYEISFLKRGKVSITIASDYLPEYSKTYTIQVARAADEVVYGDCDDDGIIQSADARTALRIAVGLDAADAWLLQTADVTKDGSVSAEDARSILRVAVGLDCEDDWYK